MMISCCSVHQERDKSKNEAIMLRSLFSDGFVGILLPLMTTHISRYREQSRPQVLFSLPEAVNVPVIHDEDTLSLKTHPVKLSRKTARKSWIDGATPVEIGKRTLLIRRPTGSLATENGRLYRQAMSTIRANVSTCCLYIVVDLTR